MTELEQIEHDARATGRAAKRRHIQEKRLMSEPALVAFATGLAHMYLHEYMQGAYVKDVPDRAIIYVSAFRDGYEEVYAGGSLFADLDVRNGYYN